MEQQILEALNSFLEKFETEIEEEFPSVSKGQLGNANFIYQMLKEVLSHYSPDTLPEKDLKKIIRVLSAELEDTKTTYTNNILHTALKVVLKK